MAHPAADRVGPRYVSHDEATQHADKALQAMTSRSAKGYERFESWQDALRDSIGAVRPVPIEGGRVALLADNRPLGRHGPQAIRRANIAASATLWGADVMWMGDGDDWTERFVEGDGTALEQLWSVSPQGALDPAHSANRALFCPLVNRKNEQHLSPMWWTKSGRIPSLSWLQLYAQAHGSTHGMALFQ